jgi:excisionase family DNA binding protein
MQGDKSLAGFSIADRLASNGALSVDDVAAWAGVGRGTIYEEIRLGRLKIAKIGRRTIVRAADARAWLASLSPQGGPQVEGASVELADQAAVLNGVRNAADPIGGFRFTHSPGDVGPRRSIHKDHDQKGART